MINRKILYALLILLGVLEKNIVKANAQITNVTTIANNSYYFNDVTSSGVINAKNVTFYGNLYNFGITTLTGGSAVGTSGIVNYGIITTRGSIIISNFTNYGDATLSSSSWVTGNFTNVSGGVTLDGGVIDGVLLVKVLPFLVTNNTGIVGSLSGNGDGNLLGSLKLLNANNTYSGILSGNGSLIISGGHEILIGDNDLTGSVQIGHNSILQLGDGGWSGSLGSPTGIVNNGDMLVDRSGVIGLNSSIEGIGNLTKNGDGTLILSGQNTYSGFTNVNAGTLQVDGSTGTGDTTVSSGATLIGTGTVGGNAIITSGATLSAGDAIGDANTLTVAGNLSMNQGSVISLGGKDQETGEIVTIDGLNYSKMTSDLIKVMGNATLTGGTADFSVLGAPSLKYGQVYTLVSAANGVVGKYDSLQTNLQSNYTYISPALVYTGNDVDLMLRRNSKSFSDGGDTRNGSETGHGLDNLPENSSVVQAIEQLNGNDVKKGLNALSGEMHASARTALIQDSFFVRQSAFDRLAGAECDGSLVDGSIHTAALKNGRDDGRCYSDRAVLWGEAYGSLGHNAGDGNAASMHHSTAGFIMGADTALYDSWRVGGLIGYGRSMFDVKSGRGSSGHSNNVTVGGYAGNHWGNLNLRLGATYTWDMLSIQRTVNFTGYRDRLSSGYLGGTAQAFAELGYKFRSGHTTVEPFGNVAYVNLHTNGYNEHGGAAALHGRGTDTGVMFSTFGIRAASTFQLGKLQLTPRGSLSYRHAFGLTTATTHEMFAAAGNGDMDIAGVALSTDAAVIDTGITAKITDRLDVGLSYIGQYGKQSVDSGARARFRLRF